MDTYNIEGKIVKEDDRYIVKDNTFLNNLVISTTTLHPEKSTSGHKHEGQEEVYIFMKGSGRMELDDKEFDVKEGGLMYLTKSIDFGKKKYKMVGLFDAETQMTKK